MNKETKDKLFEAWAYCDWKDKSTEFMLEYMKDSADVEHEDVIRFVLTEAPNRQEWYKENPNWYKKYE